MEQVDRDNGGTVVDSKSPGEAGMQWPAGLKAPKGARFAYVPIGPDVHGQPDRGDIVVILWELSYQEEKLAAKRSKGEMDLQLVADQKLRAAIRAVDGQVIERATGAGDVLLDRLLESIGMAGRQYLLDTFVHLFMPSEEAVRNFRARVQTGTIA